jgi:peptide/nickel transport system permease protein
MSFILRRLAFYLAAAWVAITLNFFIPRALPGNPVEAIIDKYPDLTPSAEKALALMLGGGQQGGLWSQYVTYLGHVFTFNFGTDPVNFPTPVSTILAQSIPWTLTLVGVATVISFVLGTGLGILAGWRNGGWLDRSLPGLMFLQAMPYFFLALVLVDVIGIELHWLPTGQGYNGATTQPGWDFAFIGSAVQHAILPAFTIVITSVAGWMLQMRNVMITTTGEDYVVAAQAKGLRSTRVVFTYAARNALLPQLQGFGLALGFVVSGALVMEIVFAYPGIGLLLLNAVSSDDYPLMQAIFLVITFTVLLANLIVDMVIVFIDPRVRAREVAR